MCCCGKPTVNGEFGYRWQPNDTPSVRPANPPSLTDDDTLLYDEPGRCGGIDCHSHHFRVAKSHAITWLLVRHGGGDERIRLPHMFSNALAAIDPASRYWVLSAIHSVHKEGERTARECEASIWRKAAAEGRIKTRKQRGRDSVKVWIEPGLSASVYHVTVFAVGENQEETDLGSVNVRATTDQDAQSRAFNELWDSRLNAAGCKVRYECSKLAG